MSDVYTLHRNVAYEFGSVVGVFCTLDAAIAHAMATDRDGEYTIEQWTPSDDPVAQNGREVWNLYRGIVKTSA